MRVLALTGSTAYTPARLAKTVARLRGVDAAVTGAAAVWVHVVEHDGEDAMAIHPVMHMALSHDHRIVDGVAANTFLWRVREILEEGDFTI